MVAKEENLVNANIENRKKMSKKRTMPMLQLKKAHSK
jgi:hypothetical protein